MNQSPRFVASAEEKVTTRNALQEVAHIFATHRAHGFVANDVLNPDDFGRTPGN